MTHSELEKRIMDPVGITCKRCKGIGPNVFSLQVNLISKNRPSVIAIFGKEDEEKTMHLMSLTVDKSIRRMGVGSFVLDLFKCFPKLERIYAHPTSAASAQWLLKNEFKRTDHPDERFQWEAPRKDCICE